MKAILRKNKQRSRRKLSVRSHLRRSSTRVHLCVNRTHKHIYAQLLDPATGRTLCGVGTTNAALAGEFEGKKKAECAAVVGREIARKAGEVGVTEVVFDRGGSMFHGRVKALAEAAREAGLKF